MTTGDGNGGSTVPPPDPPTGRRRFLMRPAAVQELLAGLGEAASALAVDERAAEAEVARCAAAEEELLAAGARADAVVRVLASARWRVAVAAATETRTVRREVVAWWADASVYSVLMAARGWPPDSARVGATEPGRFYDPELLARLPPIEASRRKLAEMALRMWTASTDPDEDLAELARDAAQLSGFCLRNGPDGGPELVEDGAVESRRCRLWGEVWADHRIPDLPEEDWLVDLLSRLDAPAEVVELAGPVSRGYENLRRAAHRCTELTGAEDWGTSAELAAEHDSLLEVLDTASDVLDTYARTLTAVLPALQTGRSHYRSDGG